jgi:hypothetical protein
MPNDKTGIMGKRKKGWTKGERKRKEGRGLEGVKLRRKKEGKERGRKSTKSLQ